MRKIREALRLRFELKLGYQQIARSCAVTASMVHKYLKRAEAAGLSWPLPEGWDDARLEATLFPRPATAAAERKPTRTMPDFAAIHEQLRSSKYVTLQLLWEEYRQANPDGYGYSRFCELYQRWRSKPDVVLRQEHNLNSASAKIEEFAAEWLSTHPTKSTKLEARRHILEDARNPVRQMLRLALDGGVAVNRCSKPFPFCCEAPGFLQYLKEERGLRDTTINHYVHRLHTLEAYLQRVGARSLAELSPALLASFVVDTVATLAPTGRRNLCGNLRVFLRFCHRERILPTDLGNAVEMPQFYRLADVPGSITWDEVRRMLEAVDRRTVRGRCFWLLTVCVRMKSRN